MLNFRRLTLQNFLIFGEKQEIDFNGVGVRYIYGENCDIIEHDLSSTEEIDERDISSGSGKSTLPIGALFALFGIVWKKDKIPLARVINKKYKKNCEVTVEFDIDGKDVYVVKRYREFKPYGNTVFLFKWNEVNQDWDNLSRADSDETQELIDKIIGVNYTTALKTILFSRDEVKDFLDLSATDRFKIFENIIQLNKFKEKYDVVDKKKKILEKEVAALLNEKQAAEKNKNFITNYLDNEKRQFEVTERKNEQEKTAAQQRLFEIGDINNIETQLDELVDLYHKQFARAAEFATTQKELQNATLAISHKKKIIQQIEDVLNGYLKDQNKEPQKCSACGEIQNKDHYLEHQNQLKNLIQSKQESLEHALSELNEKQKEIVKLEATLQSLKEEIVELTKKEKQNPIKDSTKKIIYNQIKNKQPVHLQEEVKALVAKINLLSNYKNDYSRCFKYVSDLRQLNKDIRKINQYINEKQKIIDICSIWISVLDVREETSIKQLVISKIIPAFNSILQETLDEIYNGLMQIQFDTMLNELIVYEGEEAKKSELSTGERARINLCINLSVYELTRINLNAANVIFMDEVFNSMDVYSINKFIGLIKRRYAKHSLVHIVSHSKGVEENLEADQVIKIQRKDRESKIIFI